MDDPADLARDRAEAVTGGLGPVPAWLRASAYHELRLPRDRAGQWLVRLWQHLSSSTHGPPLAWMNEAVDGAMRIRAAELASMDWSAWDTWDLAAAVDASLAAEAAAESFFPVDWRPYMSPPLAHFLVRQPLIVSALDRSLTDPTEPFDDSSKLITAPLRERVLWPAARFEFHRLVGPAVRAELWRRGGARPGFSAGAILYLLKTGATADAHPTVRRLAREIGWDLDVEIRALARRVHVPDAALKALGITARQGWGPDAAALRASQIFQTLGEGAEFSRWSAPEALARAVTDALALRYLPHAASRDIENESRAVAHRPPPRRATDPVLTEAIRVRIEETSAAPGEAYERAELIERFRQTHPRHAEALRWYLDGARPSDVARQLRKSPAAISKRRSEARETFLSWARRELGAS